MFMKCDISTDKYLTTCWMIYAELILPFISNKISFQAFDCSLDPGSSSK